MTSNERSAWIMLATSIPAYIVYVTIVVARADGGPLHEADYVWPALITIGVTIAANIVLSILTSFVWRTDAGLIDERDRTIAQLGERVGGSFIIIGGLAAMLMAMFEWDSFWIANALFLGFFLSGIVSSIAKVAAYRWGTP